MIFRRPRPKQDEPPGTDEPGELDDARDTVAAMLRSLSDHALPTMGVPRERFVDACEALAREVLLKDVIDEDGPRRRARSKVYAEARQVVRKQRAAESSEYSAHRQSAQIILADLVSSLREAFDRQGGRDEEIIDLVSSLESSVATGDLRAIREATSRAGGRIRTILSEQRTQSQRQLERLSGQLRTMRRELDDVRSQMQRDPLTTLYNRGAFDEAIGKVVALCDASGIELTLYMMDIDHFKAVNDGYGHQVGDQVLSAVAGKLQRSFPRKDDLVARYGGEEFVALCRNVGAEHAHMLGERVRKAVTKVSVEVPGDRVEPSISVGYAILAPGEAPADLVRRADEALYRAKGAGRNRVRG